MYLYAYKHDSMYTHIFTLCIEYKLGKKSSRLFRFRLQHQRVYT